MIHELRRYRVMPGRMADLLNRFDTVTLQNGQLIETISSQFLKPTKFSATR